jgi:hypothetical protein
MSTRIGLHGAHRNTRSPTRPWKLLLVAFLHATLRTVELLPQSTLYAPNYRPRKVAKLRRPMSQWTSPRQANGAHWFSGSEAWVEIKCV